MQKKLEARGRGESTVGILVYEKMKSQKIPQELPCQCNGNFLYPSSVQGGFEYVPLIIYL
jgi:hypothetical protein